MLRATLDIFSPSHTYQGEQNNSDCLHQPPRATCRSIKHNFNELKLGMAGFSERSKAEHAVLHPTLLKTPELRLSGDLYMGVPVLVSGS